MLSMQMSMMNPGEHWLAVYNKEYSDSFGNPPQDKRMVKFLEANVTYNSVSLQQVLTNACGFYCVYYLIERARGYSVDDIHVLKTVMVILLLSKWFMIDTNLYFINML